MADEKADKPAEASGNKSSGIDPKLAGLLSWLFTPVTSVLFLVLDDTKNDPFAQFHAKQSLYWFVVEIILWVVMGVLSVVTFGILACLTIVVPLIFLGVRVYGGYKAYQGEKFMFPVIGEMADK